MPKAKHRRPVVAATPQGVRKTKKAHRAEGPRSTGGAAPSPQQHRQQQQHASKPPRPAAAQAPKPQHRVLRCAGVVDRQAATAMRALLEGDARGAHAHSIKALTLAPHVAAKAATHAVVCQAMKFLPVLSEVVQRSGLVGRITQGAPGHSHHEPGPPSTSAPGALQDIPVAGSEGGKVLCPYNMYILVYELLLGQGVHSSGSGKGPAERLVLKHKAQLQAALQQMMRERKVEDPQALLPTATAFQGAPHPRAVRVNPLKCGRSVEQVVGMLRGVGAPEEWRASVSRATREACLEAEVDSLLPDVVLLPPGTDMHDHPLVLEGSLVLQSRASCMPAHALRPQPGWTCLDCCAAPGNKTTHVAALMQGRGRVIALDKDPTRLQRLRDAAERTGAAAVIDARCADFLALDPLDPQFAQVRGILLDPSCSGSGTVFTRMDHLLPSYQRRVQQQQEQEQQGQQHQQQGPQQQQQQQEQEEPQQQGQQRQRRGKKGQRHARAGGASAGGGGGGGGGTSDGDGDGGDGGSSGGVGPTCVSPEDAERVRQLAQFQVRALRHALRFPGLERLVYSTCSVHREENEDVVAAVAEQAAGAGFALEAPFPSWPRRGLPVVPGAEKLVRTDAQRDGTDGFFVALFSRAAGGGGGGAGGGKKRRRKQEQGGAVA